MFNVKEVLKVVTTPLDELVFIERERRQIDEVGEIAKVESCIEGYPSKIFVLD